MAGSVPDGALDALATRMRFAVVLAVLVGLASLVVGIAIWALDLGWWKDDRAVYDELFVVDFLLLANILLMLGSFVAVGMWIHRAHANLREASDRAYEFSPGWAVGWYFIPIANLFKPFQAMKELWFASHGIDGWRDATAPGLLRVWWLAFVASSISSYGDAFTWVDAVGYLANALSAACLIILMRDITRAQATMSPARVFE